MAAPFRATDERWLEAALTICYASVAREAARPNSVFELEAIVIVGEHKG